MDVLIQTGLLTITSLLVFLIYFKRKTEQKHGFYEEPDWTYPFYKFYTKFLVHHWKKSFVHRSWQIESLSQAQGYENIQLRASASDHTNILLRIRKLYGKDTVVEVTVHLQLPDGTCYKLPRHPDTAIGQWYSENNVWKAGGLKIEVVQPWSKLRVVYNGMLVRTDNNAVQHVRLNLLWISASELVYHPEDWHDSLAATAIARTNDLWNNFGRRGEDGIFQWSCAQGWFQVQEDVDAPPKKIWLRARGLTEKSHSLQHLEALRRSVSIMVISRNGTGIHLRAHSYKDGPDQVFSGCVRYSNSDVKVLKSTDLHLGHFCETRDAIPKKYIIHVQTDNKTVKVTLIIGESGGELRSGIPYGQDIVYRTILAEVDGDPAVGILELGYEPLEVRHPIVTLAPRPSLYWSVMKDTTYCAGLDSKVATCMSLVGGKGASLALLASVQEKEGYKVPPGFCLTINAFEQHIKDNPDILKYIKAIEAASVDYDELNFKEKCQKAVETIKSTQIAGQLKEEILLYLKNTRTAATEQNISTDIRFAVRSSAVGEDSEALSAAGQNETVLGCVTETDVLDGVLHCWGSMFAFNSAHYRRQNGQPCMIGAGVVIQTLVPPRAAGVLFSRHPHSGDPSRVLITANYGLGESVVSGSVEPDTIVVVRDLNDELSIQSVVLGAKNEFIITSESGITTKAVSDEDRNVACVSNYDALKLAKIAVSQEILWGDARDIEWAINQDGIYLLQARPITSLEMWSEEELLHENDDAVMSDEDLFTFANTGEVLPKPLTPLSNSLLMQPLNMSMNKTFIGSNNRFNCGMGITHYRCFLKMYDTIYRRVGKKLDLTIRMIEMSVNGHPVADERIHAIAMRRNEPTWKNEISGIWIMLKSMFLSGRAVKSTKKLSKELSIDKIDINDTLEMFNEIKGTLECVEKLAEGHLYTTSASSAGQIVLMTVLMGNNTEYTNDHYSDLAKMLRCGEAVSAELPAILATFSRKLVRSGKIDEFKSQSLGNALVWLKENLPQLHQEIVLFLENHGYRAIMEFDLSTVPWAIDPTGLIKILQSMYITDDAQEPSTLTDDEIMSSLTTVQPNKRKILRWLLSICRNMVSKRECTKSNMIYGFHKLRLAVRKLGHLMVQDWLLPNMELIFFFSAYELQKFIETRDPVLLRKASQRRQYFPKWEKFKFAEVNEGWPEPLKVEEQPLIAEGAKILATPVCAGEVVARACVVHDLSEIEQLKQGDILITHSTDIGWSPYFPLISGIVTELGGLISHGAVIARECGLPCIVGAAGATVQFRTGDLVRLSGSTGILEKVKTTLNDVVI